MNEVFADRIELDGLVMLANKRSYLDRAKHQQEHHIATQKAVQDRSVPAAASTPSSTASATEDDGSIVNRSPTTNYHIYQAGQQPPTQQPSTPQPTPVPQPNPTPATGSKMPKWLLPALLVLLLAGGLGGVGWWLATRPASPVNPATKNPTYTPDTTIKFS